MDALSALSRASRRYYRNPSDKNKADMIRLERLAYPDEEKRFKAFQSRSYEAQQRANCPADLEPDHNAWNENP